MSAPEYCVLHGESRGELEHDIARYLESGWLPQGGVAVSGSPPSFYQGMFRIEGAIRTQVLNVADDGVSVNDE